MTRTPDGASEARLDQIRDEAQRRGTVDAKGVRPPGSPFPQATDVNGYYGVPLLKAPVWTWEVPLYFFVGGAAGATAMVALAAQLTGGDRDLLRDARWIAAIGAAASGPLLIADLGRPERFLNMLRVIKLQSPMSVGAWTLAGFGTFSAATALAEELGRRTALPVRLAGNLAGVLSAVTGLGMATYTGVLLGATAIPLWNEHVDTLPIHFAASALGSSVSLLQLRGHEHASLQVLGLAAATFETWTAYRIESDRSPATEPLRRGESGITTRLGAFLSGPLPLALRAFGFRSKRARRAAAVSSLLGSVLTRFAWVEAGKASARDVRVPLDLPPRRDGES